VTGTTDTTDPTEGSEMDAAENRRILKTLWQPHPGQRAILDYDARFKIVACGRRWGKSEMAAHAALAYALENDGATVWWVSPTYDQSNEFGFSNLSHCSSLRTSSSTRRSERSHERFGSRRGRRSRFDRPNARTRFAAAAWTFS
jgi:hypothetical protein